MIINTVASVTTIIRALIDDQNRIDGRDSDVYRGDNIFTLSEDFINASTIAVFVNSVEITTFTYDSDNNQITITSSLSTDDNILIKYNYYKKYSDTEIQGFLTSSLVYFPQYKYPKTFEINDSDKIVAINCVNPTIEELYFIATIASILIDPQNIRINIPDLSLSAKRDISDQEQIKISFRNFQNFIGTVDFELVKNLIN